MKKILVLPLVVFLFLILNFLFLIPNFVYAQSSPYKIGLYYYGEWSSKGVPWKIAAKKAFCGRGNDWWCGNKDFYGQEPGIPQNTQGFSGDFSRLKPVIGYYNLLDTGVVERQIMQASQNGINYFHFYWYWNDNLKTPSQNEGLDSFLKARNSTDMNFTIMIVTGRHQDPGSGNSFFISRSDAETYVKHILVDDYFKRPNFLKTSDGRPIFSIWRNVGLYQDFATKDDMEEFIDLIKNYSIQQIGKAPVILIDATSIPFSSQVANRDGRACFTIGLGTGQPAGPVGSYQTYVDHLNDTLAPYRNENFLNCVIQTFDTRPQMSVEITDPNNVFYFPDQDITKFIQALQITKTNMDANPHEMAKYLSIYDWNEWREGGIIEPNVRDGAAYLNAINDVFNLPKGTNSCRTTGICNPYPDVFGNFEAVNTGANRCDIKGYTYDSDIPIASSKVSIFLDAPFNQGGTSLGFLDATLPRPDTNASVHIPGNHGFYFNFPEGSIPRDGRQHSIYIYGYNVDKNYDHTVNNVTIGVNRLLDGSPKTIYCPSPLSCPALGTSTAMNYSCPVTGNQVTFSWQPVANALAYNVRIDDGNGISDSSTEINGIKNNCGNVPQDICIDQWPSTSITVNLDPTRTYSWWIHPVNYTCNQYGALISGPSVLCKPSPPSPTPTPTIDPPPKGIHETADGATCTLSGYTCDGSKYSQSIQYMVFADAPYAQGGTHITTGIANQIYPYKAWDCGNTSYHKFTYQVPTAYRDGKSHTYYVYGVGIDATGALTNNNPRLTGTPLTMTCPNLNAPSITPTPIPPTMTPTRTPTPFPTPYPPPSQVIPYYLTTNSQYDFDQNGKVNMMDVVRAIKE